MKSFLVIGFKLYQVRFLLRPKPRKVIAFEMTSARSKLETQIQIDISVDETEVVDLANI